MTPARGAHRYAGGRFGGKLEEARLAPGCAPLGLGRQGGDIPGRSTSASTCQIPAPAAVLCFARPRPHVLCAGRRRAQTSAAPPALATPSPSRLETFRCRHARARDARPLARLPPPPRSLGVGTAPGTGSPPWRPGMRAAVVGRLLTAKAVRQWSPPRCLLGPRRPNIFGPAGARDTLVPDDPPARIPLLSAPQNRWPCDGARVWPRPPSCDATVWTQRDASQRDTTALDRMTVRHRLPTGGQQFAVWAAKALLCAIIS